MRRLLQAATGVIPARTLLHCLAAAVAVMALVAVGGTAAAANGVFVPASDAASQTGASRSAAPGPAPVSGAYYKNCAAARAVGKAPLYRWESGYRLGLDADRDGVACEWADGDGRDGDDGKNGRNGRDGVNRTTYVDNYVTDYLARGGDRGRANPGQQVAIYPAGGVDTGNA